MKTLGELTYWRNMGWIKINGQLSYGFDTECDIIQKSWTDVEGKERTSLDYSYFDPNQSIYFTEENKEFSEKIGAICLEIKKSKTAVKKHPRLK